MQVRLSALLACAALLTVPAFEQVRRGLEALRGDIQRNETLIRETRARAGLENRN
jgi:hypothetical protein